MLHRPLVFALAPPLHNVNMKHSGFRSGRIDLRGCSNSLHVLRHTAQWSRTRCGPQHYFQACNNDHRKCLISVRPASLPLRCVRITERFFFYFYKLIHLKEPLILKCSKSDALPFPSCCKLHWTIKYHHQRFSNKECNLSPFTAFRSSKCDVKCVLSKRKVDPTFQIP